MSANKIKINISRPVVRYGFTLVELLIVLSITSLLASIVLASIRVARLNAYNTRAQSDGYQLMSAILQLEGDTAQLPSPSGSHLPSSPCVQGGPPGVPINAVAIVNGAGTDVGLTNDGTTPFPGWKGPYVENVGRDPWGRPYYFDIKITCRLEIGCKNIPNNTNVRAVVSYGVDGSPGGGDDIFTVLCRE